MTANSGISNQKPVVETANGSPQSEAEATDTLLDDATVAAWLKSHPQFFNERPDLLLHLEIPHDSGKAISLLERQVGVFRDRQHHMDEQFREIIGNARENDVLFEITRMVILDLLRCNSFEALKQTIEDSLKADLEASAARMVFVADQDFPGDCVMQCLPSTAVRTALGELYQKQRTWCGALNTVQQQLLFRDIEDPIVSAAIVPLHMPEGSRVLEQFGQPLLLVGSTESQHFNSSLDTLFLDFIGEVLAVHLDQLVIRQQETQAAD